MARKSLMASIQKSAQSFTIEQINAKYEEARESYVNQQQRTFNLIATNAPDYLVEQAFEKLNLFLDEMMYWERVEIAKKKMEKILHITIIIE